MKVYLAGPMRGRPFFNFPAFRTAAAKLRAQGHDVFSPAERDGLVYGTGMAAGNLTGSEAEATAQYGFSLRQALGADCAWICAQAEAVAMLPGWSESAGARAEHALAFALGLDVLYL